MNGEPDITLSLPVPPSANRIWRAANGRVYKSPDYCAWLTAAGYAAALQAHGDRIPGAYEVRVALPKTRGDLDNYAKPIGDLLQHQGLVRNDRLAERIVLERDRTRSNVLIQLWALPTPEKKRKRA